MSSLQICRLQLGPPPQWHEAVGDPVTNLGGAVIPAPRQALRHMIDIATYAPDGVSDGLADRLRIRRQLRSMLNNTPLKLQAYLYVIYSDDPEQNGWYVPDFGSLVDLDASSGLATGVWKLEQVAWIVAGHRRINREARNIWMRDLRTGLAWRDLLRAVYSTDFSALPALQLTYLPHGASSVSNAVNGQVVPTVAMPTGRDGGTAQQASGLIDLATVAYDRAEAAWGLSDVILYDRRGAADAPTGGPGASWEEVYGPDYPWAWTGAIPIADAPVLDNGLVRIRYEGPVVGAPTAGFRVDVWNGSAYVEQGKMRVFRFGDSSGFCDTWISASCYEYTLDRVVVQVVLANSFDPMSREVVFITVQRGELEVTFEVYPPQTANGSRAEAGLYWSTAPNSGSMDANNSVLKSDTQSLPAAPGTGKIVATAGSGSSSFPSSVIGAASFTSSENYVSLLRCITAYNVIGPYQTTLAVLQAANAKASVSLGTAYAFITTNEVEILSQNGAGYVQVQLAFSVTQASQILEAEAMTLGANTSTGTDANASGGHVTTATRTTDANPHVSAAAWPNGFLGTYRIFARVQTSSPGLTGNFYAKTGATTGTTVTYSVGGTYAWVDLGEIVANNTALDIHAWLASAGTIFVDRIEAFLLTDRVRTSAIYSGCRDQGQAALFDSRQLGALVSR